jgi:hypothetical protein
MLDVMDAMSSIRDSGLQPEGPPWAAVPKPFLLFAFPSLSL